MRLRTDFVGLLLLVGSCRNAANGESFIEEEFDRPAPVIEASPGTLNPAASERNLTLSSLNGTAHESNATLSNFNNTDNDDESLSPKEEELVVIEAEQDDRPEVNAFCTSSADYDCYRYVLLYQLRLL